MLDECDINNGGCEQVCVNEVGSFHYCGCNAGYSLRVDGRTCEGTAYGRHGWVFLHSIPPYHTQMLMNVQQTLMVVHITA